MSNIVCKLPLSKCICCYDPCLGAATKFNGMSRSMTEIAKQKTSDQSSSEMMKSFSHVNGIAVRLLSVPNIPKTISECKSPKTSAENCRPSDVQLSSLTRCGVSMPSVTSAERSATANGHPVCHLPQLSPVSKLKIPNSCEVTSASATHNINGSKKMSNGECTLKQSKGLPCESCCSKTVSNGSANKTLSIPVQPGDGSELSGAEVAKHSPTKWNCCVNMQSNVGCGPTASEVAKHSPTKWNCCVNMQPNVECGPKASEVAKHSPTKWNCCVSMHKKDRTKTCSVSGAINNDASIVGGFSPNKCDNSTRRKRRRAKKLSTSSCHSTTKWRVTRYSDADVMLSSHDTVHATTAWNVIDIAVEPSVTPGSDGGDVSAVRQSDVSATCSEAVHGGQHHMLNGICVSQDKISDKHHTSVKQNSNCTFIACCA